MTHCHIYRSDLRGSERARRVDEGPSNCHRCGDGGLAAALTLASRGREVLVLERAGAPGGKMREIVVEGRRIDSGPTVLTLRHVFEQLFQEAGADLAEAVPMTKADVIARHAWRDGSRLDLHADRARSADEIGVLAGRDAARGYLEFCDRARRIYEFLEPSFIQKPRPGVSDLVRSAGITGIGSLWAVTPFRNLWDELGRYFPDQRLRQLYGRYATYCGSSPFSAPATLMLVAHVEQEGVWLVDRGMHALAQAMARLAEASGAEFRYGSEVGEILVQGGARSRRPFGFWRADRGWCPSSPTRIYRRCRRGCSVGAPPPLSRGTKSDRHRFQP